MGKPSALAVGLLALWTLGPAFSQLYQNRPELCGDRNSTVVLPPNMWTTTTDKKAVLHFGAEHAVELGFFDEIHEVCPLASDKLVSFGLVTEAGYEIDIVNTKRYLVADSFLAYDPLMSPNQRWIASRRFYPGHFITIPISEDYMLYDLNGSAKQNRHDLTPDTSDALGWLMYPATPRESPTDVFGIPDANVHAWRSKSFFWGADSQSIVFADSVGESSRLCWCL